MLKKAKKVLGTKKCARGRHARVVTFARRTSQRQHQQGLAKTNVKMCTTNSPKRGRQKREGKKYAKNTPVQAAKCARMKSGKRQRRNRRLNQLKSRPKNPPMTQRQNRRN